MGKSGITRKISLDYGHNQSPEQFKKSLSKPITFPYFHNFISLGKTVLDLIVIGQKQYMIQLDLTHRTVQRFRNTYKDEMDLNKYNKYVDSHF